MTDIRDAINPIAADVDAITVFAPSTTEYERYADVDDDTNVLVVAEENAVDAEQFLELPLDFEDVRDRIRFGTEGGMDRGHLDEGDTLACVMSMFSADLDSVTRVRVSESIRTGIYDLFVNSRAEADVIREVERGDPISYRDVELSEDSVLYHLRRIEEELIEPEQG